MATSLQAQQYPSWQHPQLAQIQHMPSYQQEPHPLEQWHMPASMASQQMPQYATHGLPHNMAYLPAHQPPLRPQSSHSSLQSALPSPIHAAHPHNMPHPHSHQQSMQQISLPPIVHNSMALQHPSPQQQPQRYSQPVPHQVVGQQGIRGVLPKSTGDRSSPDEACEPEQEIDGSWPCKFCGKKYRHAKHLRRHHARHTGETPYECQLCARRFGRSDVLKRHYHKCATRRGVEVGDHLAGQRGHPRRRPRGPGDMGHDMGSPNSNDADVKQPITPVSASMPGLNSTWAE